MARSQVALALGRALKQVSLERQDEAAVALARTYARALDAEPESLSKIGPRFLEVLVELGMTPKARAAVLKGEKAPQKSPLDELRERRERKQGVSS